MTRLLVNDMLSALPDHRTFWHDLVDWFDLQFIGGEFNALNDALGIKLDASLIIRNASYFGPLEASKSIPTISLLQDIFEPGQVRQMQEAVIASSCAVVLNSEFTKRQYVPLELPQQAKYHVIPLPVDFATFEPGNPMGLQQALGLPDGCICWIGASQGAAGHVKGWDIFLKIVRLNPDLNFVAVFKDALPTDCPPNLRLYCRLSQEELARVIGACRVGLCTSRTESQHLAGIEMGACGLPLVVPEVGVYWGAKGLPGIVVTEPSVETYAAAIRKAPATEGGPAVIREYWQREFDGPVIRKQWEELVKEVECSGAF